MKKIYMIGNAHIDPVWLWEKSEGMSEIKSTFRSVLDRMKEFDDFYFSCACAGYYEWIERIDPDMFAEIKERVKEGRWEITGGFWIQPDCNMPCGESFARHALYSQCYFAEKFGVTAKTGYNVDSFGHNGMMPQILRQSGMENYVYMRPSDKENPSLAENLFFWESPDGSRVLSYRLPQEYSTKLLNESEALEEKYNKAKEIAAEKNQPQMLFYGVGNHGGGPTIRALKQLKGYIDRKQINKMDRISVNYAELVSFNTDNEKDTLVVALNSSMNDYIVDEVTGKVVKGDKDRRLTNTYKLTFIRKKGVLTSEGTDKVSTTNCPNCGAPTTITSSGKCEYCGAVITTGDHDWVLNGMERF